MVDATSYAAHSERPRPSRLVSGWAPSWAAHDLPCPPALLAGCQSTDDDLNRPVGVAGPIDAGPLADRTEQLDGWVDAVADLPPSSGRSLSTHSATSSVS